MSLASLSKKSQILRILRKVSFDLTVSKKAEIKEQKRTIPLMTLEEENSANYRIL